MAMSHHENTSNVTSAVLTLAPWTFWQYTETILNVVALTKEPRQIQQMWLTLAVFANVNATLSHFYIYKVPSWKHQDSAISCAYFGALGIIAIYSNNLECCYTDQGAKANTKLWLMLAVFACVNATFSHIYIYKVPSWKYQDSDISCAYLGTLGIIAIYSNNPEYCCSDQGAKANTTTVTNACCFCQCQVIFTMAMSHHENISNVTSAVLTLALWALWQYLETIPNVACSDQGAKASTITAVIVANFARVSAV